MLVLSFISINNPAFGIIVRRLNQPDSIAGHYLNMVKPHFPGQVTQNLLILLVNFDAESGVGEGLGNNPFDLLFCLIVNLIH